MLITHSDAVIGLVALSAGAGYFAGWLSRGPRARSLDKAWDQGHGYGRDEGYAAGYAIGADDESRGLAYAYDKDGNPVTSYEDPRPGLPPGPGPHDLAAPCTVCDRKHGFDEVRALNGPQIDSAGSETGPRDWGDELSGMRATIALDDATEVLAATPPQPAPSDAWEYRLAEWMAGRDRWLAGQRAETAEWCAARGIEREEARTA